jgi:hypothetical protein
LGSAGGKEERTAQKCGGKGGDSSQGACLLFERGFPILRKTWDGGEDSFAQVRCRFATARRYGRSYKCRNGY